MLSVNNIRKSIEGKLILDDISFSLKKGKIVGLIGRNGVGKTTLLRTLVGILDPDSGSVTYNNVNIHTHPEIKQKIAYVPDSTNLLRNYSIKEIVKLYEMIYNDFDTDYFYELLNRFNLPDRKIRGFSKGMQALLNMILSFSTRADLIILDEPTNGLDPIIKRQILQFLIEEVSERDITVLLSTHHLDEMEKIADTVIMMKEASIESITSMDEAKNSFKKIQVVYKHSFPEKLEDLSNIVILNKTGRVTTLLIKGNVDETMERFKMENPLLLEELPMTLEDVFVTTLGGEHNVS